MNTLLCVVSDDRKQYEMNTSLEGGPVRSSVVMQPEQQVLYALSRQSIRRDLTFEGVGEERVV